MLQAIARHAVASGGYGRYGRGLVVLALVAWAMAAVAGGSRLATVQAAKQVRVCIWPEYYGISYRNAKSGAITGIDADLARELAHDLGVGVQYVDSSFARLIDDVTQDKCDVAMFAIGITPQRAERLAFTRPHLRSDVFAVTTRNNARIRTWEDIDRPGNRVAVAAGTFHEPLMRERLKQAELAVVRLPQTREGELEAGRVDVFMSDYPFTRKMLDSHDWVRVIAPPGVYHQVDYAFAVKPGDAAWLARLDAFIGNVRQDGRLLAAARRYKLEPILVRD